MDLVDGLRGFCAEFSHLGVLDYPIDTSIYELIENHFRAKRYSEVVTSVYQTRAGLDPILSMLSGRAALKVNLDQLNRGSLRGLIREERFSAFEAVYRNLLSLEQNLFSFISDQNPAIFDELERYQLNLYVMRQYALFHLLQEGQAQGRDLSPWENDWMEFDFHHFNDYSKVSLFTMDLCPISDLWNQFTRNRVLFEKTSLGVQKVALVHPTRELSEIRLFPIAYPML